MLATTPVPAQYLTRPQIPWRTISTARFDIHFPAEMEEWTSLVARQMESVADAVHAVVGNAPASRITVIVEDPSNVANGFALPFLEGPIIFLWPTPPSPSPTFGSHRGWGEVLAIHEYGHIAHLTFPSRNPRERLLWKYLPVRISPVTRKAPAWVIEGYATLIEGQLTTSGRPYSSGRAAVLRQWALEGRFPTYAQLNGSGAFLGGNMRYLVGSAFLEWLQQRKGDSSLVHLWRRMSARVDRSFEEAFIGVFGAAPSELYGAFTVDMMDRSLQVRARLRDAGLVEGELVQRLSAGTGDPAISPDGQRLAMVIRSLSGPSRLVVISTRPDPDSALRRLRERMLRLDSLDVAPFDSFPRPRRALATLRPFHGRTHEQPRWMPDGIRVLVSRDEPAPNGITRPDLFLWNTRDGGVRRVTREAAIRHADPSPDGRQAAGVRCHAGTCSVVLVDLERGSWRQLAAGSPELVWHRPRFSPDGSRIAVSYQTGGQWNVALIDVATGAVTHLPADAGVSRHSPSFTPDGQALVVVSDRGGIPNLERVPLDGSSPRTLSRVTGAVAAPEMNRTDRSVWFLALRSGGYDLRRLTMPDETLADPVIAINGALTPIAPPTAAASGFRATSIPVSVRQYGVGPRRWRLLPGGTAGPDGHTTTLMLGNIDPIGRLSVVTQGTWGSQGTWRGLSSVAGYRRFRIAIDAGIWALEHEPSRSRDHLSPVSADLRSSGIGLQARLNGEGSNVAYLLRAAASGGRIDNGAFLDPRPRLAIAGEARGRISATAGTFNVSAVGGLLIDKGSTDGDAWLRSIASATLAAATARYSVRADWLRGSVTSAGPGELGREAEQFVVGGAANPLVDPVFLSQRIALPSVPAGFISGPDVQLFRATLGGNLWEPYFVWVNAGDAFEDLKRIGGVERTFGISSLGFAKLPSIRARAGASYSFDEPYANHARLYLSLTFTP
jgi:Tol biopolymer transport system component